MYSSIYFTLTKNFLNQHKIRL